MKQARLERGCNGARAGKGQMSLQGPGRRQGLGPGRNQDEGSCSVCGRGRALRPGCPTPEERTGQAGGSPHSCALPTRGYCRHHMEGNVRCCSNGGAVGTAGRGLGCAGKGGLPCSKLSLVPPGLNSPPGIRTGWRLPTGSGFALEGTLAMSGDVSDHHHLGWGCYWHLAGGGQGCCQTSHRAHWH